MPTVDLPGMRSIRTDSACIARHRSSARPVILLYFTPASGLNSKVVTTGPGMDLHDRAFDRELAALLLEQARAVHQLALVDLALGLRAHRAGTSGGSVYAPMRRSAGASSAPAAAAAACIGVRGGVFDDRRRRGGRRGRLVVVAADSIAAAPALQAARLGGLLLGLAAAAAAPPFLLECFSHALRGAASRAAALRATAGTRTSACSPSRRWPGRRRAEQPAERELRREDHRERRSAS